MTYYQAQRLFLKANTPCYRFLMKHTISSKITRCLIPQHITYTRHIARSYTNKDLIYTQARTNWNFPRTVAPLCDRKVCTNSALYKTQTRLLSVDHNPSNDPALVSFLERANISALYVGHSGTGPAATVLLNPCLFSVFHDPQALEENLKRRGAKIDIHSLIAKYHRFVELAEEKLNLESQRKENSSLIAEIVKQKTTAELNKLKQQYIKEGKELREKYKDITSIYNELEQEVTLGALRLPASIHHSTPDKDEVLLTFGEHKLQTQCRKSHAEIAQEKCWLIFNGQEPGGYYLLDELARCQMTLETRAQQMLDKTGYTQIVCPDMVRKNVQEGCGKALANPEQVFMVHRHGCDVEKEATDDPSTQMYLTGVSPQAFLAYLTMMEVSSVSLPLRLYSTGSQYRPSNAHAQLDLTNVAQANVVVMCGVCAEEESSLLFEEMVKIMTDFYKTLDVHFRLVRMSAPSLRVMESARTELQMWLPSKQTYITVGEVALWGDYASRRLTIKSAPEQHFLHTVHCELVNVPSLLALLLESTENINCNT